MPKTKYLFILFLLLIFVMVGCQTEEVTEIAADAVTPTETAVAATETPAPTNTPEPTATDTPAPTNTPTATPEPTETAPAAKPTNPPATKPTATATADPDTRQEADDEEETAEPAAETQDEDLLALIAESETALMSLRTYKVNQVVNVSAGGTFTQTLTQSCQVQQNDGEQVYCQSMTTLTVEEETFESQNEIVQLDDTLWMRADEEVEWTELPPDALDQSGYSSENIGELRLSNFITETIGANDTVIDGVPVQEIDFVLDVDAYFGFVMGEETAEMFAAMAQDGQGVGKIWLGQEDLLPRKMSVEMSFIVEGESMIITVQGAYTDFNEPVIIPDPTAVN